MIIDTYVDTGRVMLGFSDFPLENIHPAATRRAAIAECAGRQGRFWEVHDLLFANPTNGSVETDSTQRLDQRSLAGCLATNSYDVVRARQAKAAALGIRATPTLFIGMLQGGQILVTDAVSGLQSIDTLSSLLDRRLR